MRLFSIRKVSWLIGMSAVLRSDGPQFKLRQGGWFSNKLLGTRLVDCGKIANITAHFVQPVLRWLGSNFVTDGQTDWQILWHHIRDMQIFSYSYYCSLPTHFARRGTTFVLQFWSLLKAGLEFMTPKFWQLHCPTTEINLFKNWISWTSLFSSS